MRYLIICFLVISFYKATFSQNEAFVDSLKFQIQNTQSDTLKADLWNQISAHYLFTNTVGAQEPALKAKYLSERINYTKGQMDAINRLGIMFYRLSDFDSSIVYLKEGLSIATHIFDSSYILKFRGNIALNYASLSKYEDALKEFLTIISIYEITNPKEVPRNLLEAANIYYHLNEFDLAYKTANEAQILANTYDDLRTSANALNSMGVFLDELKRFDESTDCYQKSYEQKKILGDKVGQANTLINLSTTYSNQNQIEKANSVLDKVILLANETGSKQILGNAYVNLGANYAKLKQYSKSIEAATLAYDIFIEMGAVKHALAAANIVASNNYAISDYKNATKYYRIVKELNDSVFSLKMAENIVEMQTRFETEKKEEENKRLLKENELQALKIQIKAKEKRNSIIIISSISVFLMLLFLMFFFRFRFIKKHELATKIAEQKALNLIEVIEAEENERVRFARDLHDGLGQILSTARINMAALEDSVEKDDIHILNNSINLIDQSVSEVRNISHNIMPVSLMRYGLKSALEDMTNRIKASGKINIETSIEGLTERLIESVEINMYRLVQEIINNVLKHAEASFIKLRISQLNNTINIYIENDGKQFDISTIKTGKGIGWNNIYARINMMKGSLELESNNSITKLTVLLFI